MAVEIGIEYLGELRCQATHGPSGITLLTDAPVDNHGKGEAFSPTDLVATALGTCIVTTIGIVANRHQLDLRGTQVHVEKHMASQPARRIGELRVRIVVPRTFSDDDRQRLETAALHCPVHKSLHPDVQMPIEFVYGS